MRTSAASRPRSRALVLVLAAGAAVVLLAQACARSDSAAPAPTTTTAAPSAAAPSSDPPITVAPPPALRETPNVYAAAGVGDLSPAVRGAKAYVYVPSNNDGSVTVIDQATMAVVDHYRVGKLVQHVVPSWDLRTLYANASGANRLVPIDPTTGKPGPPISVDAPYNLYFTPDGTKAVVMAERRNHIDYYDPHTWQRLGTTAAPCAGVNHADWSVDGRWFVVTCEFSGQILKVDSTTGDVLGVLDLPKGSMPQDVRLTPDGTAFYVADMMHGGLWVLSADGSAVVGSIPTGVGTHGIYPSRDGRLMYVSNRGRRAGDEGRRSREGDGSVSVVDPSVGKVVATWTIPGGGSPDMGGVSADGRLLWLSGRYDAEVYAFDTRSGQLVGRIKVPSGPHGLCVFPQPGRYSLGHTGDYR
jgi:DNA-binding beta-propeller fold protein YncE